MMLTRDDVDISTRRARESDARDISSLYREAYSPNGKSDARNHYPFPQFLDAEWVVDALKKESICWLVAVYKNKTIGTVGALLNIGAKNDQITESFGLVIKEEFRNKRIGTQLYNYLCASLRTKTSFLIAETRTANPGGYCIVRRCNFIPVGFEPYAHFTPNGHESMLITAKISASALQKRQMYPKLTRKAHSLAVSVIKPFKTHLRLSTKLKYENNPIHENTEICAGFPGGLPVNPIDYKKADIIMQRINIRRDDVSGPTMLRQWETKERRHGSGVISLSRLEGEDKDRERYDCQYFVAEVDGAPVACARFVLDKIDKRSRLLQFHTACDGFEDLIISHVLEEMERKVIQNLQQVVIDIRADRYPMQKALEALDFFPTAYYPALIEEDNQRIDAIQYTRIMMNKQKGRFDCFQKLEWPLAQSITQKVSDFWSSSDRSE